MKTLLEKKCTEVLNNLWKKDNKKSNLICIGKDKNGNKRYTSKSKNNKLYLEYLKTKKIKGAVNDDKET